MIHTDRIVLPARRGPGIIGRLLLLFLAGAPLLHAQVEVPPQPAPDVTFAMDAISFADQRSASSRIDVFVQVGYDALSFVKNDDRYFSSYELTVTVYDSAEALVNEKLWTEEVKGVSFEESVSSSAYSLTRRAFPVTPGRYTITVVMRDLESKVTRRLLRKILVSDYATPTFSLSDIMLISRLTVTGEKKSIVPNVTSNVGMVPDAIYLYFEGYNKRNVSAARFVANVLDQKGNDVLSVDTTESLKPGRNEIFLRVNHTSLPLGDYKIIVRAFDLDSLKAGADQFIGTTNRAFIVRWPGLPRGIKDLDLAIDQVRYIANDDEYSAMKDAKTPEEKQKKLQEFWKKRDPNPNTPRNERMEEYYARVEYANKSFAHYIEGWRTDMGMVYIMFGPPSDVSRHPFEVDSKPYEVWRYYDINYDFVFVDETGFGDYRLLTPVWEAWQRVKH